MCSLFAVEAHDERVRVIDLEIIQVRCAIISGMRRVFADKDRLAALLGITRKLICINLPSSEIKRRHYTMVGSAVTTRRRILSPPHTVRFLVVRCRIARDCPISFSVRGSAMR